ncbi:MAG TPA: sugar transferase [Solirubrobacterales bacterium]|nr:sugar transferase [Solirubrobacterales bacterium]
MSERRHYPTSGRSAAVRSFPYLTGLTAQGLLENIAMRLAPAVAAAAITYAHFQVTWEALLVGACLLCVSIVLRRPQYPMQLIPFASSVLHLLAAPLGAALALAIITLDGYAGSDFGVGDMIAPVLGAWVVTAVGSVITHRFRGERQVRIAVIGSHEFTRGLQEELKAVGIRGSRVIGCFDPERPCEADVVAGVRCLGSLSSLRRPIIENNIELLVLGPLFPGAGIDDADPGAEGGFRGSGVSRLDVFERVADACLDLPVSMIEAGQLYEQLFGHVPLGTTTSAWFQYLLHPNYKQSWPLSKRLLDIGVGLLAAIVAAPILLISAIAIKLSDGGPILYRQTRIGEKGREIELLKLRTMDPDPTADAVGENGSGGHRITPVGKVLRRLHINELPQIWLVLKGQMSLVGPRPEIPDVVSALEGRFTYYDRRHLLKPGITGWASVRCGYSGTPVGEAWKLCHDLFYLKRQSVLFDVLIMLETLSTVFLPEPANRPDERFIVASREAEEVPGNTRPREPAAAS